LGEEKLKYFTAPALAKFSRRGQDSYTAQTHYHRANEIKNQGLFEIKLGEHDFNKEFTPVFVEGQQPNKDQRAWVWKIVEKKTDVNLAVQMYRDAAKGMVDQLVLCSNDRDAQPALAAIRKDFPPVVIGVVTPRDGRCQHFTVKTGPLDSWAHHGC
jgi:uncharacterized LabA/DUF88 family protein